MSESEKFNLRESVNNVVAMFLPMARAQNVRLDVVWDGRLPAEVHGDAHQLRLELIKALGSLLNVTEQGYVRLMATYDAAKGRGLFEITNSTGLKQEWSTEFVPTRSFGPQATPTNEFDPGVLAKIAKFDCNGKSLAQILTSDYLNETGEILERLSKAAEAEQWDSVRDLAHALGGWSLTLGLNRMRALCAATEATPERANLSELRAAWQSACKWLKKAAAKRQAA